MGVRVIYLVSRPVVSFLFRIPLLGYALRIIVGVLKLPRMNFHLRRLDREAREDRERATHARADITNTMSSLHGQQDRVAGCEASVIHLSGQMAQIASRLDVLSDAFPQIVESASSAQTAIRMLRRERLREPDLATAESAGFGKIWFDPQIEIVPERLLRREKPATWNRMPRLSDWSLGGPLSNRMRELNEPHVIHRKSWEYAICVDALADLGVVTPDAVALAVGAGSERPLYYYANTIKRMVATDLYDNALHEGTPVMLTSAASFAPFPFREDHLEVIRMGGDDLAFNDDNFDFSFCLSSIEHFGSRETQRRAFKEMGRVTRPGGIVCIITELVLNGEKHHEYFTPAELWDMFLQETSLKLVGPLDMRMSDALPPLAADVRISADLTSSPHIVLTDGRVIWTSLSMFFRKQ